MSYFFSLATINIGKQQLFPTRQTLSLISQQVWLNYLGSY